MPFLPPLDIFFIIPAICLCIFRTRLTSCTVTPDPAAIRLRREAFSKAGLARSFLLYPAPFHYVPLFLVWSRLSGYATFFLALSCSSPLRLVLSRVVPLFLVLFRYFSSCTSCLFLGCFVMFLLSSVSLYLVLSCSFSYRLVLYRFVLFFPALSPPSCFCSTLSRFVSLFLAMSQSFLLSHYF